MELTEDSNGCITAGDSVFYTKFSTSMSIVKRNVSKPQTHLSRRRPLAQKVLQNKEGSIDTIDNDCHETIDSARNS
jgi:hypothetical protein